MTIALTWKQILSFDPCPTERRAAAMLLRQALGPSYRTRRLTVKAALDAGVSLHGLLWLLRRCHSPFHSTPWRERERAEFQRRHALLALDYAATKIKPTDAKCVRVIVAARARLRGACTEQELNAARKPLLRRMGDAANWTLAAATLGTFLHSSLALRPFEREWLRQRIAARFAKDEPEDWPAGQPIPQPEAA